MPFAIIPSVPDASVELPVGRWLDTLLAPLANDVVLLVSEDPFLAKSFSSEDLLVDFSNLGMVLVAGSLELNHRLIVKLHIVLAEIINVLSLLELSENIVIFDDWLFNFGSSCKTKESHHNSVFHLNELFIKLN